MNKIDEAILDRFQHFEDSEIYSYESLEFAFIELDAIASLLMAKNLAELGDEELKPSEVFGRLLWNEESAKTAEFEDFWSGNQYGESEDEESDWEEAEECRTKLVELLKPRLP
jgi:hypothetical protein